MCAARWRRHCSPSEKKSEEQKKKKRRRRRRQRTREERSGVHTLGTASVFAR
jgi:hypothetical protein